VFENERATTAKVVKDYAFTDNLKHLGGTANGSSINSLPINKSVVSGNAVNDCGDESKYLGKC
jgi:hypothetical protein